MDIFYSIILLLVVQKVAECQPVAIGPVIATTSTGKIGGTQYQLNDAVVNAYFSIPFAKSPTGSLRFKEPQPIENWQTEIDGTRQPNCCIQPIENLLSHSLQGKPQVSEDCLYLNLWTPATKGSTVGALPVIVVLHGGGFSMGCINMKIYDGFRLSEMATSIVVTVNSRLGALGFINLHSEEAPGNMGLMDQQMALRWIYKNIKSFGGDSSKIMILGDGSGGASVAYQMLSPGSAGLFSKAFIQSGNILSSLAFVPTPVADFRAGIFLNETNCIFGTIAETSKCLRSKNAHELTTKSESQVHFGPTIDGKFIHKDPRSLLLQKEVPRPVPLLTSVTKNEGSLFIAAGFLQCSREIVSNNITDEILLECVKSYLGPLGDDQIKNLIEHYKQSGSSKENTKRQVIIDLVGDVMFVCPSREFANLYSGLGSDVYFFVFDHLLSKISGIDNAWMGVVHGSDFSLLFDDELHELSDGLEDELMAENVSTTSIGKWPIFNSNNPNYVLIGKEERVGKDFQGPNCNILDQVFLSYEKE